MEEATTGMREREREREREIGDLEWSTEKDGEEE